MIGRQARYIGCIPLGIDIPESEQDEVVEVLHQINCFPVFLKEDILRLHYHGFCKKILWPVIHNSVNMYVLDSELIGSFDANSIFTNPELMNI